MANFVAVVDPDPYRRRAFLSELQSRIAPLPGLVKDQREVGPCAVRWATGPRAPVSVESSQDRLGLIWGDAIPGPGPVRLTAGGLLREWLDQPEPLATFDGYFAALVYSTESGLKVGGDIMGMFPLYYWRGREVTLVGSSAALFPLHPEFPFELDRTGLAGVFRANGQVANRSIYRGVRRVPAGHVLELPVDGPPRERMQFQTSESDRYYDLSLPQQTDLLFEVVAEVMRRQIPPGEEAGLLLSGGLDSRTLAGHLARQGTPILAMTMGWPRDYDASCAALVARELGMRHRLWPDDHTDAGSWARIKARWEHLSLGFHSGSAWHAVDRLAAGPARVVAGYAYDTLQSPITNPGQSLDPDLSAAFDRFFPIIERWGLPAETIGALVGDPELPDQIREELRREFTGRSRRPGRATWQHILANRSRLHLGGMAWHMSFGAWPVLPVLDRALHELAGGLPMACLTERRVGTEVVRVHFPKLARIPLDRFNVKPFPVSPSTWDLVKHGMSRRMEQLLAPLPKLRRSAEWRRYFRGSDLNGPNWRAIREEAELGREAASGYLDRAALNRVLPGPGETIRVKDGIKDASGYKLLLGFLLWSGNRGDLGPTTILGD